MNLREAAQSALEALEKYQQKGAPFMSCDAAVDALRAALNQERYVVTGNEFHGAPPEPYANWGDAIAAMIDRGVIQGLRISALAEDAMQRLTDEQQMIERGTKAWAGVPDATAWVEELRGNEPVTDCHEKEGDKLAPPLDHIPDATKMMATSQESRQVEPVAYVTGYFGGRCVIRPVEAVLFPVGMALYRSPPTINEMETVEPVAWMCSDESLCRSGYERFSRVCEGAWNIPVYTAPPKRSPLTDEEISKIFIYCGRDKETFARAIERAHGIGGEE